LISTENPNFEIASIYKTNYVKYPEELDELDMALPCLRCLRGTKLEYESAVSTYKLFFKDYFPNVRLMDDGEIVNL
jgi:hypothetical protein